MQLTHISLFTGRGGFDEGAEAAGFATIGQSEIDPWCVKFLEQQYPGVPNYGDITKIKKLPKCTVISGGFPCQDISISNTAAPQGLQGDRSGLFYEIIRLVRRVRPPYVVLENSPMLLVRGMHSIIAAFTEIGYGLEWQCLQATHFGYPHSRERIYIIAYPLQKRWRPTQHVFKPLGFFELSQKWAPGEAYLRVSGCRANAYRDNIPLQGNDGFPAFFPEIRSYGNAVMPVIAEYLFKCIRMQMQNE